MITPEMQELLKHYNLALRLYKEAEFEKAIEEFQKAIAIIPDDGPSLMYIQRCKEYIHNPPPPDWDGVFVMTTK
ncbi:MAG: tetratricopeptide repeat protein [Leptospiraceae bacterium]|nr:tetratricopeptide repeat protein [Leptospiraceae bacterium]MCP5513465.1 tetratricopeptide repeat protein [Leptospiraceae bacterium]